LLFIRNFARKIVSLQRFSVTNAQFPLRELEE
jgi:hypothetical protein